jgi:hypothetical protein
MNSNSKDKKWAAKPDSKEKKKEELKPSPSPVAKIPWETFEQVVNRLRKGSAEERKQIGKAFNVDYSDDWTEMAGPVQEAARKHFSR